MKVLHIAHSGFLVETPRFALLFDYWKGTLPEPAPEKRVVCFVSHAHRDHWSPEIFAWGEQRCGTLYLLSDDVPREDLLRHSPAASALRAGRVRFLPPQAADTPLEWLRISTLPSTDAGVAWLAECDGLRIFHAGDLNWWLWGDEDTPQEAAEMTEAFQSAVSMLKGIPVDLAFLPLDPRQPEDQYWLGMDWYATRCEMRRMVPMHTWNDPDVVSRFLALPQTVGYRDRVLEIPEGESRTLEL